MTAAQARSYLAKSEEYFAAAENELEAERGIAATSLAIHAAINSADAFCGVRLGKRAAGQDHDDCRPYVSEPLRDSPWCTRQGWACLPRFPISTALMSTASGLDLITDFLAQPTQQATRSGLPRKGLPFVGGVTPDLLPESSGEVESSARRRRFNGVADKRPTEETGSRH